MLTMNSRVPCRLFVAKHIKFNVLGPCYLIRMDYWRIYDYVFPEYSSQWLCWIGSAYYMRNGCIIHYISHPKRQKKMIQINIKGVYSDSHYKKVMCISSYAKHFTKKTLGIIDRARNYEEIAQSFGFWKT